MDLGVEETEETPTAAEGSDGEVRGAVVAPTPAIQVENQYQGLTHTASAAAAVMEAGTHTVGLSLKHRAEQDKSQQNTRKKILAPF